MREQNLQFLCLHSHGGVLIVIGMEVETKDARPDDPVGRGEGSAFLIVLPQ